MEKSPAKRPRGLVQEQGLHDEHVRAIKRRTILRLFLTYLAPLILLSVFFSYQYSVMVTESRQLHLKAIAENQANTLDLFLSERLVDLSNVIDDPKFTVPPSSGDLSDYLEDLRKSSPAFVDIGYFDPRGIQEAYAGPYPSLEKRNYSSEDWYVALKSGPGDFIITDIYLGFRNQPHFTIAVSRTFDGGFVVLRATLAPEGVYEYIRSLEGAAEVYTSIVNREGYYQLVTSHIGTPLETSSFVPPRAPRLGAERVTIGGSRVDYAYSWLRNAEWALLVQYSKGESHPLLSGFGLRIVIATALVTIAILVIIFIRASTFARLRVESDETKVQLEHAAKLASVGELAAGIAHEINNPLAAISEESGLMKDLLSPDYPETATTDELVAHLDSIGESVFRCRDITRKLLGFVRSDTVDLRTHNLNEVLDSVVDGFLVRELAASNITIDRRYSEDIPPLTTDGGQLQQVFLNILNNAVDAIGGHSGRIAIKTSLAGEEVHISISDTGSGMTVEQMEKIFLPFYTTKEVGRGTGLGLSVSYGIIKDLGGRIEVESTPGAGSTFTIVLPVR
jgi:two-component system NtrC family sensor kinase